MKNEMADKINEATEIYQKGLEMMKQSTEASLLPQFSKESDKLEEFMVNTVGAPMKSSVNSLLILQDS